MIVVDFREQLSLECESESENGWRRRGFLWRIVGAGAGQQRLLSSEGAGSSFIFCEVYFDIGKHLAMWLDDPRPASCSVLYT